MQKKEVVFIYLEVVYMNMHINTKRFTRIASITSNMQSVFGNG